MKMDVATVLYAFFAALIYAATFYVNEHLAKGEEFDPSKFLATLIVGLLIGLFAFMTGNPITQQYMYIQLLAYAGLIILIEKWLKLVIRGISGKLVVKTKTCGR